ncbi:MAG: right-handed parallel beta-helix repeat-containing protein [Verrucomicrobiota bacterium]
MKTPLRLCLLLVLVPPWSIAATAPNGVAFDVQGCIDQQLAAGKQHIVVPPGRYRVTPKNREHLALRGLKDITIIADGVEMICTETTRALTLSDCTNVTLRGLVIDYDPLPFTQGRISGFSADKSVHEIELFDGYPPAASARNFKYEIFRPDTRTLRCDDRYLEKIEVIDARHLRLIHPGGRAGDPEQVGDLIVIGAEFAPHGSAPHAIECSHNVNVRLENIDLFASNCFGFIETDCDGSTYYRCRINRRPPASDPVPRAAARLRSLDADAYHSKHAIKGPAYLECTAFFMGDDCINICGDYHLIMSSQGRQLRVLAKGAMNVRPGDPLELVLYTGQRLPDAKAVSVEAAGPIRDDERAFLAKQNLDAGLKSGRGLGSAFNILLDRDVDIPQGGVLCAANRNGNGFAVKGCEFGCNRSRGILIKASNGEITGNRIDGAWMSAILVAPEYWWLESGSSSGLRITGNTITACRGIPICVEALAGDGAIAPAGAHRNIIITGNTVKDCAMPGILVTSTAGLKIANNALDLSKDKPRIPGRMLQAGLHELQPVIEINCAEMATEP